MPDTIYNDLKQKGLILSQGFELQFPAIKPPKPTFIGKLASYVIPQVKIDDKQYELIIEPILNNSFIVGRSNTLMCYRYQIDKQTSKPIVSKPNINNLRYKIQKIHICDPRYLQDRAQIPFLIQSNNQLTLFYLDLKQNKIIEKNSLKFNKIYFTHFICDKQFVIISDSLTKNSNAVNNEYQLSHVIVQSGKIKIKNTIKSDLRIQPNQQIKQINIVGNIDQEQQSIICLFYYLKIKGNTSSQILKVKQYSRDLDGFITPLKDYNILNNQHSIVLTDNYDIMAFDLYYCIVLKHDILILKKKFHRYLFIDNVNEKMGKNTLKLHQKALVTTHSGSSMEINIILFNDPNCYSKLLDNIEIDQQLSEGFLKLWPYKNQKESSLIFVFKKDKTIILFNMIKMDPNDKMLIIVQNTPKQQLTKRLSIIQEIAVNLGITKKNFYLHQWGHSKRQLPDVYQFLLPCEDIYSIKKQLRMTMRKIKIEVSQLLKILQKIGKIIKHQLKSNLSQNLLKQYIKNDFLYRKIKLKDAGKKLDHRQLDRVYNSSLISMFVQVVRNQLYPSQKQQDPLHAMVQPEIKQQTNLKHVFQMFKMVILQNYKDFLIKFISNFTPDQIINVIENYYFLLPIHQFKPQLIIHEPDYMTEVYLIQINKKSQKHQPQQFCDMTSIQFNQQLSKQRIQKQLHDYYPNSKLHQAINTLINSQFGLKQKLQKHGLISCTMIEYKQKLKQIQDIKLFLKVCQYVNGYNLSSNNPKDDLSIQILQIFRQKNKLDQKAYQMVHLYTSMHRFMLKNNFYQKRQMTTQQLINLTSEDLVALFFLQNKQRKQFIFKDFRNLFVNLYQTPHQFNQVINKFINSSNCSRIQLQIFINQIKQQMGTTFQIQNQDLLQLIIDGFCKKLQIRQDNDTCRFLQIMEQIQLSKKLAMKINKIIQVRKCVNIFNQFNCQKQSYYNILKYEEDNQIFKLLLDRFFNQNMKRHYVKIQDEQISLDYCRNMLTVLLFLQQSVYYDVDQRDLLLTYGQVLIEWRQFDVIKGIIYDQKVLQKLQIQQQSYIIDLISNVLSNIYEDQQNVYDSQTKQHIRNILQIIEGQNQIKIRQYAKLQLVDIFQSWNQKIRCNAMQIVVNSWAQESNKRAFIQDIINDYTEFLNFQTFKQVYAKLQMAAGKYQDQVDLYSQQFIGYSLYYSDKLLQNGMYDEIINILAFVKYVPQIKISYALISQTFLQTIISRNAQNQNVLKVKQAIQYFTQYFSDNQRILRIFENRLQNIYFESLYDKQLQILVNSAFCIKNKIISVKLDLLWQLAENVCSQMKKPLSQAYYSYYFLIMIFRDPEYGFTKNHKISYSLQLLTQLLFKLDLKSDQHNDLWAINSYSLFKKFKRGLYLQAITRIKQINSQEFKASSKNDESQLEAIKNKIKQDKQNNFELIKCISRVQNYLAHYKVTKRVQKMNSIQQQKNQQQQSQQNSNQNLLIQQVDSKPQFDIHVTLNLKKFRERKYQISNASVCNISERDILEQIYQIQKQQKQEQRQKIKTKTQKTQNFLLPSVMNMNIFKNQHIKTIKEYLIQGKYQKLQSCKKQQLIKAAQSMYNQTSKDFYQMIKIFDSLKIKIVDIKKIQLGKLCEINQNQQYGPFTEQLKIMLPFNYLIKPSQKDQTQFRLNLYSIMRNSIPQIVQNKSYEFIQNLGNFILKIMEDSSYLAYYFIDIVILMGTSSFSSANIIRLRKIMHILNEYPNELSQRIDQILNSYKQNTDLLQIIKQQLIICLKNTKNEQIDKYIQEY